MNIPPLKPGDIIDVIAPAGWVSEEDISQVKTWLEGRGFTPRIPADLCQKPDICHRANRTDYCLQHIERALHASDSRAIWAIKGGYGTARLFPGLYDIAKPKQMKWLIGFSDITALHLWANQRWGWESLHAPVLFQLAKNTLSKETASLLAQWITGEKTSLRYDIQPLNPIARRVGKIFAPVVGGNLSLLQTSIGTPWQVDAAHKLLFVEEIDEQPYRIDRMFRHLRQAGILDQVSGLLFGDMIHENATEMARITQLMERIADNFSTLPCFRLSGIGHGYHNFPLPLNSKAKLTEQALVFGRK